MNIQYFKEPMEHVIVEDFLPLRLAKECLIEAVTLQPKYIDATIQQDHHLAGGEQCNDCKVQFKFNRNGVRDNQVVYLDKEYNDNRTQSIILKSLHAFIFDPAFKRSLTSFGGMFPIINQVTSSEAILSRYGKCDFYGWHTDTIPVGQAKRILTFCYYFNKPNHKFKGGQLNLSSNDYLQIKSIEPKHNMLVIFYSNTTLHSVSSVDLEGSEFDEGRFSINFWVGFNNNYRWE